MLNTPIKKMNATQETIQYDIHYKIECDSISIDNSLNIRDQIDSALSPRPRAHLLLDFEKVNFIDTAAITMLVRLNRQWRLRNSKIMLFNLNNSIYDLLLHAGFNEKVEIFEQTSVPTRSAA